MILCIVGILAMSLVGWGCNGACYCATMDYRNMTTTGRKLMLIASVFPFLYMVAFIVIEGGSLLVQLLKEVLSEFKKVFTEEKQ